MWIDLTHTIKHQMPKTDGDFGVRLQRIKDRSLHGYEDHILTMNMHTGTHIDLPGHFLDCPKTLRDMPLDKCIFEALKFTYEGTDTVPILPGMETLKKGMAVVIATGFDRYYFEVSTAHKHPLLSQALINFLVNKGIGLIALDTPSPDVAPYQAHTALLAHNIPIIENLKNAVKLPENTPFTLYAIPLKIATSASPVRVFAKIT